MQCKIETETQGVLSPALQGQLELLRSRGFIPTMVYTDPQSAFCSLTTQYPGVVIDVGGVGDYVSKVDAKIRCIKELYRSVKSRLLWKLPPSLSSERPSSLRCGLTEHTAHYGTQQEHMS
jgi:hypothetical protein